MRQFELKSGHSILCFENFDFFQLYSVLQRIVFLQVSIDNRLIWECKIKSRARAGMVAMCDGSDGKAEDWFQSPAKTRKIFTLGLVGCFGACKICL